MIGISFKCAYEFCQNRETTWPHTDFVIHIHRMHPEEGEEELIRRYDVVKHQRASSNMHRSIHPFAETSAADMPLMASVDNDMTNIDA